MFEYMSSPMRWCETIQGNAFLYSEHIVEFWNTLTSFIFCILAIYGYINNRHLDVIPWIYLFSIGITSAWFHATLSFMGQFCDELSIILLIAYCLKIFYNIKSILYNYLTILVVLISWIYPNVSPPILLCIGLTLITTTYFSIKNDKSLILLWMDSMKIGIVGVICWLFDFICYFNTHTLWHVFISIAAYYMILLALPTNTSLLCTNSILPYWKKN